MLKALCFFFEFLNNNPLFWTEVYSTGEKVKRYLN